MKLLKIDSWDGLAKTLESLDGWAFRGEQSADWDLFSSLSRRLMRFCPDAAQWREREARAMRIFRRKAHNYLQDHRVLEDDLRTLAMMQHHGGPTRLLDFTKSPFVAAFFALEHAEDEAAVFALDTPRLWSTPPRFDPSLTRERIDPRQPGNFEHYFAPNTMPLLWAGEPAEMDRRLTAQSGLFLVPGVLQMTLDQILREYEPDGSLLVKIVVPARLREQAMKALYRMNITYATLFPDLDGLARSMGYELEVLWQGPKG
ncbi:MAG: FRG domain-containing protein [Pseudomonadota bacterium]